MNAIGMHDRKRAILSILVVAMMISTLAVSIDIDASNEPVQQNITIDLSDDTLSHEEKDALEANGGTADYNAAANTLYLDDITFLTKKAKAIYNDKALTIVVGGDCTVGCVGTFGESSYGINAAETVIEASPSSSTMPSLTAYSGKVNISGDPGVSIGVRSSASITVTGVELNATGKDADTSGNSFSCGIRSNGLTLTDSVVNAKSGFCKAATAHSFAISCDKNNVTVSNTTLTATGGSTDCYYGGKCYQAGIFVGSGYAEIKDGSKVTLKTEASDVSDICFDYITYGIEATDHIAIASSTVSADLGDAKMEDESTPHMFGFHCFTGELSITDSAVSIACGEMMFIGELQISIKCGIWVNSLSISGSRVGITNAESHGEGRAQSYGILCDNTVTITGDSEVLIESGTVVSFNAESYGVTCRDLVVMDSTLVADSGPIDPYEVGMCYGLEVMKGVTLTNSLVVGRAVAGEIDAMGAYYGAYLLGDVRVIGSSFIVDGTNGGFGGSPKFAFIQMGEKVFGSLSSDDPVFEDITAKSDWSGYKVVRFVTEGDYITVSYDLNGAKGTAPASDLAIIGFAYAPKACDATMHGFKFGGWSDGVNTYRPGETMIAGLEPVTLKAVWVHDESKDLPEYGWLIVGLVFIGLVIVGAIAVGIRR